GTDLHGVAAEVGAEGLVGEREHLGVVAPLDELDEGVARHLVREARATGALYAALAIEVYELADRDRLGEVPLFLDEAALARPERQGLVLQRALPTAVAHRAVE